ncbi:hypothetical protein F5Y18DRAFT_360780 [Xylariaceae sp. FL1019]|nr:hypothetical protein F5Y18DRAFT_360780 [Xylariaceae sp. FL1019]
MMLALLLLATLSCVDAAWLRWSVNREPVWAAQETGLATVTDEVGWTPIPTPAPGLRKDGEDVLELLRRGSSTTDWENSNTCGWFAGISSSAIVCGDDFTCATNSDHVVACASGTISPFYTACLDFKAFEAGSCSNLDAATGCCDNSKQPACGTYIWTGAPERFMYKCFETASALSILDVPQFVLDASLFSKTHTTSTPTITSDASESNGSKPTSAGSNSRSGTDAAGSASATGSESGSESGSSDNNSSSSTNSSGPNTPVIVGAAVGGTVSLLLLLLLLWYLKRKMKNKFGLSFNRNKKTKTEDNSTTHHHTTNVAAAKGRNSSISEATTARPGTGQPQENHYHHQEHFHYPGQSPQPRIMYYADAPIPATSTAAAHYQGSNRGQPVSTSTTVNDHSSHARAPLFSYTSNSTTAPASSDTPSNTIVGGIASRSSDREQPREQSRQQEGVPAQLQPINHIHIYHSAPMHQPEGRSPPRSETQSSNRETQINSGIGVHNHVHYLSEGGSSVTVINKSREQDRAGERSQTPTQGYDPRDHGHTRDISTVTDASGNTNDWSAIPAYLENAGPGYRQSM